MTDQATGAAEQPALSIKDSIEAAFAEQTKGVEPATIPDKTTEDSAAAARARDERGRFAAKAGTDAPPDDAAPATTETDPVAVETTAAPTTDATPQHWSAEDKALIAKLPAEHQAAVVDRFKKIEAGFTPKLQRAAALEKDYGEIDRMFEPSIQAMQAQGWTKPALIKAWADVEAGLARDPIEQVGKIIQHYKINTQDLAKRLGLATPAAAAAPDPAAVEFVDPAVKALQEELNALKGTLSGFTEAQKREQERQQAASQERTVSEIQAFADAKGEDGNPSHPLFNEVMSHMLVLAQAERAAGRSPVLATLYDQAVWANPETRAKQLAADRQAEQRKAALAQKAKTEAARKAGSSVTGAPSSGGQASIPKSKGSRIDDIRAAFDELSA